MKNSNCEVPGYLHDYQIFKVVKEGVVEVCTRCKDSQYFPNTIPNHIYLSFHMKQLVQKKDPRFKREYPHFKK
jgi:hypothetical protein